jgi:rare lipoprotein A
MPLTAPRRLAALAILAIALPAGSAMATSGDRARSDLFVEASAEMPSADAPFAAHFAPFDSAPAPIAPPAAAVDIGSLATPLEPAETDTLRPLGNGVASFYGRKFHGRRTASGEQFDMNAMTAAHRTLPFGTRVRVTNPRNGRSVVVRINDRGPFSRGRTIDLSRKAAGELGIIARGHAQVELDVIGG